MQKLPICLSIITKNETMNLRRCLESAVDLVSEVIVVDSFSTDDTAEIAKQFGAKVFSEEWKGFGLQKQSAAEKSSFDWVLNIDADEALSDELKQELRDLFAKGMDRDAYEMPRLSFHMGRWIRHGGWYPDYQTRLFHKDKAKWSTATLHEKIEAQSKGRLKGHLKHYVFRDLSHQIEANNRYSTLGAEALAKDGRSFSVFLLIFKPWTKFLETYFWKLGFLDGIPGFVIAVGAAYSMFLRHAKLWEIRNIKSSQK